MLRRWQRNQLSIALFLWPFNGPGSGDNLWLKPQELTLCDELDIDYSSHFAKDLVPLQNIVLVETAALISGERFPLQSTIQSLIFMNFKTSISTLNQ